MPALAPNPSRPSVSTKIDKVSFLRSRSIVAQQQGGWVEAVDQGSGQTYYYNQQTGETSWTPPQNAGAQQGYGGQQQGYGGGSAVLNVVATYGVQAGEYVVGENRGQQHGMQGLRAGEDQVLGRYNMLMQKDTVSRAQCTVYATADGRASLVSNGKGPTLWRNSGGYWNPLHKGEMAQLSNGDQIALDQKEPENAVFTVEIMGNNGQQGGYGQQDQYGGYAQQDQYGGYAQQDQYGQQQGWR